MGTESTSGRAMVPRRSGGTTDIEESYYFFFGASEYISDAPYS